MLFNEKSKKLLSLAEDRISFLYIEKAKIQQTEYSIEVIQDTQHIEIPITTILCLIIGPGVSITHRAVENIAKAGCSICWMGESGCSFYCFGEPVAKASANILLQMRCHENNSAHLAIVRKMYEMRYPDAHIKSKSIEAMRGLEGLRVKKLYEELSNQYNIKWNGRVCEFDNMDADDIVNRYITSLNQYLYAVVEAIINIMGFSPAIGFIHTGNMKSFVFDIADLYKEKFIIPASFKLASQGNYNKQSAIYEFRNIIEKEKLTNQIVKDIKTVFIKYSNTNILNSIDGALWDFNNFVKSGTNYAKSSLAR